MTTPKPIHIFRAGKQTTSAGEVIEFTQADLQAAAAAYNPSLHEAPLVIGHPKTDDPAYGWAKNLTVEGDDLYVTPDQVNPEFAELVQSGAFKKRSAKFYRPTDPNNPTPGVWYLQHVGFLGAKAPAIKGLQPAQFAHGDQGVEFADWEDMTVARLFRSLREFFIGKFGQDDADRALNTYDIESLATAAAQSDGGDTSSPSFTEPDQENQVTPEQKAALEAENARLKAENEAHARREAEARTTAIRAAAVTFCEGLIGEGKLLPAERDTAIALHMMAANSQPVEFGEGDSLATEAPLPRLESLLKALPKRVEFGEHATTDRAGQGGNAPVEFAAPDRLGVDAERMELHRKAVDYQAKHPGTEYVAAVRAVQ